MIYKTVALLRLEFEVFEIFETHLGLQMVSDKNF